MITPLRFRHPLDIINPSMYKMLAILFDSLPEKCTLNSPHIFLLPSQNPQYPTRSPTSLTSCKAAENGRSSKEVTTSNESNKTQRGGSPQQTLEVVGSPDGSSILFLW